MTTEIERAARVAAVQAAEEKIMRRIIADALAAGYSLGVNDGEDTTLKECRDAAAVFAAMRTTDTDHLLVYENGKQIGWVFFVYGNDGYDVVNDYTTNLEHIVSGADEISEDLESAGRP